MPTRKLRFAVDSPVEGDGFEPSFPQQIRSRFSRQESRLPDGLTVSRPGTQSSNPSSGESVSVPHCRAQLTRRIGRVLLSIAPHPWGRPRFAGGSASASLLEACSDLTRVTAHRIAQPPKAAFVTRLRSSRLPDQTARQLPEQSTIPWMHPSSTGDTRRRGALFAVGTLGAFLPSGSETHPEDLFAPITEDAVRKG
jgi:hypothetical protein